MSIIGWIVLGLIAGFIGSKIVNKTGEGFILDIVLGIVGALPIPSSSSISETIAKCKLSVCGDRRSRGACRFSLDISRRC